MQLCLPASPPLPAPECPLTLQPFPVLWGRKDRQGVQGPRQVVPDAFSLQLVFYYALSLVTYALEIQG